MNDYHFPRHRPVEKRPVWWPENESWPPTSRRRHRGRGRFFRRMGCLGGLFAFSVLMVFTLFVILAADAVGVVQISGSLGWIIPLGAVILLLGFGIVFWAGRGLRRAYLLVGNLIEAADRLAEGDFSVRVAEQGPPEVRSLIRNFNSMSARLEASAIQRQNFMADVAHELRTPLTVIRGNLEGMLDGVYPADEVHLRSILEETELLSRLVDDLRMLALAESGGLQLKKEKTDLGVLLGETIAVFQPQADTLGIALRVELGEDMPQIELDAERIRQVVSNLISNSLRYTPSAGNIHVRLSMEPKGAERWAKIEIQDSGRGIAAKDLPHVFERFYRESDSGGMGLGLSIAKTLVEAHGGRISVENPAGKGSVFRVVLPVDSSE